MGDGEITLNVSKLLSAQLTYVATDLVDVIFPFCCVSFLVFFFFRYCLFIYFKDFLTKVTLPCLVCYLNNIFQINVLNHTSHDSTTMLSFEKAGFLTRNGSSALVGV